MPSPQFEAALQHFPRDIAVPGDDFRTVRAKFEPAHGHDPCDAIGRIGSYLARHVGGR